MYNLPWKANTKSNCIENFTINKEITTRQNKWASREEERNNNKIIHNNHRGKIKLIKWNIIPEQMMLTTHTNNKTKAKP